MNGRTFDGLDDLNAQGRHWLGHVANVRVHGTTQARLCERLAREALTVAGELNTYQVTHSTARTVTVEALVGYETNDYSVHARWVGERVSVDAGDQVIHNIKGESYRMKEKRLTGLFPGSVALPDATTKGGPSFKTK